MTLILKLSPNCDARNANSPIDTLIMHYTGMQSADEALTRMCDSQAEVSAHYMVDEDGTVYQLVEGDQRAWHAGISHWRGREGLNHTSIGIEIVNPGHEFGYAPFPKEQMDEVIELTKTLLARYPIEPRNIIGHSDIAPERKEDPGELFDWAWLAREGIGLFPDMSDAPANIALLQEGDDGERVTRLQKNLAKYGYGIACDGNYGTKTASVAKAFKRHFCPDVLNTSWDSTAEHALQALLRMV